MTPLDLVKLRPLMERTRGTGIAIGLIDGPVALGHPDLAGASIREVTGKLRGQCVRAESAACAHGTFVAGILCGRRGSTAPAICPDCTLLIRPIFAEAVRGDGQMPGARPEELAAAVVESIDAGARVLNLSVALARPSSKDERELEHALDQAARHGVIVVAAAGNQATVGISAITRHPWVIPVAACDLIGRPAGQSNLGSSIGRRGLRAPGDAITSLGAAGGTVTSGGTSAAAAFVTGTVALLWSERPDATAAEVRDAVTRAREPRRRTVVPALLDAWASYRIMGGVRSLSGRPICS
ncbi:MAG: peptidase in kexin sedolisin [Gemmataceae bacterium]|nr:peptidase in kexin sedolisin [Gemmataceae bacterium]